MTTTVLLGEILGRGPVTVPTAFAQFPADLSTPPRSFTERFFNIQRWTRMPAGGHFTAWEQPDALAEDLCAFLLPQG